MDDFSNHLSAKDAQETPKTLHGVELFAEPKIWLSYVPIQYYYTYLETMGLARNQSADQVYVLQSFQM